MGGGSEKGARLPLLFCLLYASEGAPVGFLWWALPVRLREQGVPPEKVASLLSLLVLPWALKVLWAPVIDAVRSRRVTLKTWIVGAQILMSVTLLPLLFLDPVKQLDLVIGSLMLHAAAAATQDVGIDTLAIRTVPEADRGTINGWMQIGMLGSRAVFGGGVLLVLDRIGITGAVLLLIGMIWTASLVLLAGGPSGRESGGTGRFSLRSVLGARSTWIGLAFAATGGAAFKSTTALAGPFLVDRGADAEAVGVFFALPVVTAMALGAGIGGKIADAFPRVGAVAVFEGTTALLVLGLGAATLFLPEGSTVPFYVGFVLLYFSIGLATASVYALFMDVTNPATAATQFCAFMGGINLCEAWSTRVLGAIAGRFGYGPGMMAMSACSLVSLAILPWLGRCRRGARGP